jgi:hypothetical protein
LELCRLHRELSPRGKDGRTRKTNLTPGEFRSRCVCGPAPPSETIRWGDWEERPGRIKRVLIKRPTRGENAAAGASKKGEKTQIVDVINSS